MRKWSSSYFICFLSIRTFGQLGQKRGFVCVWLKWKCFLTLSSNWSILGHFGHWYGWAVATWSLNWPCVSQSWGLEQKGHLDGKVIPFTGLFKGEICWLLVLSKLSWIGSLRLTGKHELLRCLVSWVVFGKCFGQSGHWYGWLLSTWATNTSLLLKVASHWSHFVSLDLFPMVCSFVWSRRWAWKWKNNQFRTVVCNMMERILTYLQVQRGIHGLTTQSTGEGFQVLMIFQQMIPLVLMTTELRPTNVARIGRRSVTFGSYRVFLVVWTPNRFHYGTISILLFESLTLPRMLVQGFLL